MCENTSTPPSCRPLIGEQCEEHKGRCTLVFDLDETLICAREGYIQVRPHAAKLLAAVSQDFEVVVWTAGCADHCKSVLYRIDPRGTSVHHVIHRNAHWYHGGEGQAKDLSLLGRNVDNVLIVENSPESVSCNPQNAIILPPFEGNNDDVLAALATVLKRKADSPDDVPTFLAKTPLLLSHQYGDLSLRVLAPPARPHPSPSSSSPYPLVAVAAAVALVTASGPTAAPPQQPPVPKQPTFPDYLSHGGSLSFFVEKRPTFSTSLAPPVVTDRLSVWGGQQPSYTTTPYSSSHLPYLPSQVAVGGRGWY